MSEWKSDAQLEIVLSEQQKISTKKQKQKIDQNLEQRMRM